MDRASSQLPACRLPLPQDQTEPLLSETIPTAYSVTSGLLRDKDHVPKEAFHPSSNPDALKHHRFSLENCWLWGGLKWGHSTVTPGSPAALFPDFAFFSFPSSRSLSSLHLSLCGCVVAPSYPILCDPMDFSLPGSSVHGILQARILEWVVISSSRGFSGPRDRTPISCVSDSFPAEPLVKPWSLRISEKSSFFF